MMFDDDEGEKEKAEITAVKNALIKPFTSSTGDKVFSPLVTCLVLLIILLIKLVVRGI